MIRAERTFFKQAGLSFSQGDLDFKQVEKVTLRPALKLKIVRGHEPRSKPCLGRQFLKKKKTFKVVRHIRKTYIKKNRVCMYV